MGIITSWATDEGWNPGLYDADCFYAADPNGFFIGLLGGIPIGCISAVAYGDSFGFIGLFVVMPDFRGAGFGAQLLKTALEYLEGRNAGLDGVLEQHQRYRKAGFQPAYRNIRYQGTVSESSGATGNIISLSGIPFKVLANYDDFLFPTPRHGFLKRWIRQPGCAALGAMKGSRLTGYSVMRQCRSGFKIGPLFADDANIAEQLFNSLSSLAVPGAPIILDTPEVNPEAIALAIRHRMNPVFETDRMYNKGEPKLPLNRWFGVTTLELG